MAHPASLKSPHLAGFCLQTHPDNPLLQVRGQAGTHDIDFAHDTLEQLKSATSESSQVGLVRYDKSAHEGRGDRAPGSKWQQVKGKVDVVLFEGWMLGFKPLTDQAAEKVITLRPSHHPCPLCCAWTSTATGSTSQVSPSSAADFGKSRDCIACLLLSMKL